MEVKAEQQGRSVVEKASASSSDVVDASLLNLTNATRSIDSEGVSIINPVSIHSSYVVEAAVSSTSTLVDHAADCCQPRCSHR